MNGSIGPDAAPTVSSTTQVATVVDSTPNVALYTSIGVGFDGLPVIAYFDNGNGDLKVAKCVTISCTGTSTVTTLDSTGFVGSHLSLAIGVDGLPVISYTGTNTLKVAKCINASCTGTPIITVVDSTVFNQGQYTSITIGADGLPIISYQDSTNSDLRVAKCVNVSCTGTSTLTTLDSTGSVGRYTSIAIGADSLPIISYHDTTNQDLKVAKCLNASCTGTPTITLVDGIGDYGFYSKIAIGTDSLPVIAHYDNTNGDLRVSKCVTATCTGTATTTILDSTGSVGVNPSITIGTDSLPIISYYDATNTNLKVAKCVNTSCTGTPTLTTVDSSGALGTATSLAIGVDSLPIISYQDSTAGAGSSVLKALKCATQSCSTATGTAYSGGSDLGSMGAFFNNVYAAQYWGKSFQIADFADVAENYTIDGPSQAGDIVRVKQGTTLTRTSQSYDGKAIGVISTNPGITLGAQTGTTPIALAGRVPVNIASDSASIEPGDMITSSNTSGKGMKATHAGMVVGTALESWTPEDADGQVLIFVNRGFYDPDLFITESGDISIIAAQEPLGDLEQYTVKKGSETVERKGLYSELFTAKLKAGEIEASKITVGGKNLMDILASGSGVLGGSTSASLQGDEILNKVQDDVNVTQNRISSLEIDIDSMNSKMASMSGRFETLESLIAQAGSTSGMLEQLLKSPLFSASSSATSNLQAVTMDDAIVGNSLQVLGRTTLTDLGVTGTITAGVLSVNGLEGSLNTVGEPLKLQNLGAAGVDILAGKVTINTAGDIQTTGTITVKKLLLDTADAATKSVGNVIIPAGQRSATVQTGALTKKSEIFLTPKRPVTIGAEKTAVNSFTVSIEEPLPEDLRVSWWVVN